MTYLARHTEVSGASAASHATAVSRRAPPIADTLQRHTLTYLANRTPTWHDRRAATPSLTLIVARSHADCRATPGTGPEFVYGFEDSAGYYRMYVELMRHWDTVLPGKIPRIQHEELVTECSATVHCSLEFCNLNPESACFALH